MPSHESDSNCSQSASDNGASGLPGHLARLAKLRQEGLFCDLQVTAQGRRFLAHKCVLAAVSSYFMQLLTEEPNCHHFCMPRRVTAAAFGAALEYIYTGCLDVVSGSQLIQVHLAASLLRLQQLASACAVALLSGLTPRGALGKGHAC